MQVLEEATAIFENHPVQPGKCIQSVPLVVVSHSLQALSPHTLLTRVNILCRTLNIWWTCAHPLQLQNVALPKGLGLFVCAACREWCRIVHAVVCEVGEVSAACHQGSPSVPTMQPMVSQGKQPALRGFGSPFSQGDGIQDISKDCCGQNRLALTSRLRQLAFCGLMYSVSHGWF